MGLVYPIGSVVPEGLPSAEHFSRAIEEIRRSIRADHGGQGIVGGAFGGSVIRGDYSLRSDLDLLVVTDPAEVALKTTIGLLSDLRRWVQEVCCVSLEVIMVERSLAEQGLHDLPPPILDHFTWSSQNSEPIGQSPTGFFGWPSGPPVAEMVVRNYLIRRLSKILSLSIRFGNLYIGDPSFFVFLRKIVETPFAVARKMLWFWGLGNPACQKKDSIELYRGKITGRTKELFDYLLGLDQTYSEELVRQLEEKNETNYRRILSDIHDGSQAALKFIRLNLLS